MNMHNERRDERRIVFGAVKNAANDLSRDRKTHGGLAANGRKVADEWPLDLVMLKEDDRNEKTDEELDRQRYIIKGQIRECTRNLAHVLLVERRLFEGESVSALARELGVKQGTAHSAVRRARLYLGLSGVDPADFDPTRL